MGFELSQWKNSIRYGARASSHDDTISIYRLSVRTPNIGSIWRLGLKPIPQMIRGLWDILHGIPIM